MQDTKTTLSAAGHALAAERWGTTKPVRLANELVRRCAELPEAERQALRQALEEVGKSA
jgi:hypothetical protein